MTARPLPVLLAACLAALAPLVGCGDAPAANSPAEAKKAPADAKAAPPETATYAIRHLFVEVRDTARSPTKPARTRDEALAFARATVARLRAPGADFVAIAREVSDDVVTSAGEAFGGFRSFWAGDEAGVVEAASKLAVGEVSDPVPAPAGFHVVQRLSREEGRAIEARVVVPMEGMLFRWVELDPRPEPRRSRADAYAEAADAVAKLHAGAQVERLALEIMNVRTFALPMRTNVIPGWEAFIAASYAAKVGEWIGPIETSEGWAVARRQPYARAGVRHFVVGHRDSPGPAKRERSREEALAIALAGFKRLTDDPSAWNQVVADASDEPGSRAVGGYIGDFTTVAEPAQRMAPEIERELLRMTPGARSDDVVESRFGFHVFWRLD